MIGRGAFVILAGCGLLASCTEQRDGTGDAILRYGPNVALRGIYRSGFEISALTPCDAPKHRCKIHVTSENPFGRSCWAEFTPAGMTSFEKILSMLEGSASTTDQVWIEGTGRMTVQPGRYGHLGAYSCQVEIDRIRLVDPAVPDDILVVS